MKNKSTDSFDLAEFRTVEDIIFLDEPILTHLERGGKDYFLYLVKSNESSDTFLLFEVDQLEVFEYLNNSKSLWEIIKSNQNFFYVLQQDYDGKILSIEIETSKNLDPNFLPSQDSYVEYSPTENSPYYKFLEELKAQSYLLNLRKEAFYIKIEPRNHKYRDTLGFMELSNQLLNNVSKSYKNFLEADFHSQFKSKITDEKKLKKSFNKVKDDLDYRMVDLKYSSFEIGLAIDKTMKNTIKNKDIKEWSIEVGKKYKDLVLDRDYDSSTVDKIIEEYTPEERKKIFEPIFKIIEDPNFILSKREFYEKEFRPIKIREKSTLEKIIPTEPKILQIDEEKDLKVVKITTVIDSKKSKKSIKLDQNTLFDSTDSSDYMLHQSDFKKLGYDVDSNIEIPLQINTQGSNIKLKAVFDDNEFDHISSSWEEGIKKITSMLYEYLLNKEERL